MDASTTDVFIAKALKSKEKLTLLTHSMEILLELTDVSGWNILSTGGTMKKDIWHFLVQRPMKLSGLIMWILLFFPAKH